MNGHARFSDLSRTLIPLEFAAGHEYAIELRQFPIVGVGEHNYWILRDLTTGKDVAELHGHSFDKTTGEPKMNFGGSGDLLGFVQSSRRYFKTQDGVHVTTALEISGPSKEIERRWNAGLASAGHFNGKRIAYDLLGGSPESGEANSNGAARSIGAAMGLPPAVLESAPKGTWRAVPGWKGRDLHEEHSDVPRPEPWGSSKDDAGNGVRIRKITPRIEPVTPPTDLGMAPADGDGAAPKTMGLFAESRDDQTLSGGSGNDALLGGSGNHRFLDNVTNADLDAEAERLIASRNYYDNADKQTRIAAIFKEIVRREGSGRQRREEGAPRILESPDPTATSDDPVMLEPVRIIEPFPFARDFTAAAAVTPDATETRETLLAEADDLIATNDYYRDPHKQRRVAAIFRRLYPGQIRTAPLDSGEGI
jgi:hypothetical protein